jgi:hypothetical protein
MSFLKNLFGAPSKQRTMLDDFQEVSGRLILKGYRKIAAEHGCAPTNKTTDAKILEIYTLVTTAFHKAAERRGERIPALIDNHIVYYNIRVARLLEVGRDIDKFIVWGVTTKLVDRSLEMQNEVCECLI